MAANSRRAGWKMPRFSGAGVDSRGPPWCAGHPYDARPADTCLSIYFQHLEAANTYANDLQDLAHYYREYRRLMRHWRAVLPAGVLLEVPYEGLVEDLEGWARKMLEFIDLPWDARCLEFHATKRIVVTASKWQVRQKLRRLLDCALAPL